MTQHGSPGGPRGLRNLRIVALALFAGGGVMVAVAAQIMSGVIADRALFGQAVSPLFYSQALLGLGCTLSYLVLLWLDKPLAPATRRRYLGMGLVMLACVLGYFGMQPIMAELRLEAGAGGVMSSSGRRLFGMLHGVLLLLYLVQTALAIYLLWKETRKVDVVATSTV